MPQLDLRGHTAEVSRVAFSPDGKRIVTGSADGTAKLWDAPIDTGQLELKGHTRRGDERGVQPGRHARRHRQRGPDGEAVGRQDGGAAAGTEGAHERGAERGVQPGQADRHRQ